MFTVMVSGEEREENKFNGSGAIAGLKKATTRSVDRNSRLVAHVSKRRIVWLGSAELAILLYFSANFSPFAYNYITPSDLYCCS
jgi:hypothetical protein